MDAGLIFSFLVFVMDDRVDKRKFKMNLYQAVKSFNEDVFVSRLEMILDGELVGVLKGEGVDSFGAVYSALHQAKLNLLGREKQFGWQFYHKGSDGDATDERVDWLLGFSDIV